MQPWGCCGHNKKKGSGWKATGTQVVGRGVSPATVQLWQRCPHSRCKCGSAEPSPGAEVRAVGAVPVQMRPMAATDLRQLWRDRIRDLLILRVYVAAELEPIGEALPRSSSRPPTGSAIIRRCAVRACRSAPSECSACASHARIGPGGQRAHAHAWPRDGRARTTRKGARARESGQARRAGASSPVSAQVWRG